MFTELFSEYVKEAGVRFRLTQLEDKGMEKAINYFGCALLLGVAWAGLVFTMSMRVGWWMWIIYMYPSFPEWMKLNRLPTFYELLWIPVIWLIYKIHFVWPQKYGTNPPKIKITPFIKF